MNEESDRDDLFIRLRIPEGHYCYEVIETEPQGRDKKPGQGGPEISSMPARDLSLNEFTQQMEGLMKRLDDRADQLGLLEATMLSSR